ncbi:MAG: tRNA uridine-5-carboxymethylaminomethyl(34) synthesis enzyme MnmG, partial [Planctomycetota bacterium]
LLPEPASDSPHSSRRVERTSHDQTPGAYTPGSPGAAYRLVGVRLTDGREIPCGAAILCAGTFMRGLLHCGEQKTPGGRHGAEPARGISQLLLSLGFDLRRLKTGTSARMDRRTIDFSVMEAQPGDNPPQPFSFTNEPATFRPRQLDCWLTRTTPATHQLILANLHRSPMYAGEIEGTGPRYCPSIEDKVVRFAGRDSHQVFVEPEGFDTDVTYLAGISTSLPAEVQDEMMRTLPGLERARILRHGYAVEYDFLPAAQVDRGLMTRRIGGFFLAGQILGTSGYEEAAAQGLIAGFNAARYAAMSPESRDTRWSPFALGREQAYIGVMIDDLITKVPVEPYRMFTSRAEHRLLLRSDNADRRLTPLAEQLGAVPSSRGDAVRALEADIATAFRTMHSVRKQGVSLLDELRRPEVTLAALIDREPALQALQLSPRVREQVEIDAKYEGYLKIQSANVARQARLEHQRIPRDFDFSGVKNLGTEARQKLSTVRPDSVGQAQRIAGVNPSDIAVLLLALATT